MNRLIDAALLLLVGVAFGAFMYYVVSASPGAAWGLR
jgi:hypothetical protein